jgi:hypothetical protein
MDPFYSHICFKIFSFLFIVQMSELFKAVYPTVFYKKPRQKAGQLNLKPSISVTQ